MASFLSTGPALAYVGTFTAPATFGLPVYLGTFEKRPKVKITPSFQPVMNDLFGPTLPADRFYFGKEGEITGIMNRFNMVTLRNLMRQPATIVIQGQGAAADNRGADVIANAGTEGGDTAGNYGAMMTQDSLAFVFYLVFSAAVAGAPTAAKRAAQGLPPGYRFLSTFLEGPHDIDVGSGDFKQAVMFRAQRQVNLVGVTRPDQVGLNLYDYNVAACGAIN